MEVNSKKVVMISGANRGIGFAIVQKLLSEGYIISAGVRIPEELPLELASVKEDQLLCQKYDARNYPTAETWIKATVNKFGKIDALINNAGILHTNGLEEEAEDLLDDMWEVNAKGPLRLTRLAFPYLRKSGSGRIIDIISMSGKRVKGDWVGYSMSKYAAYAVSQTARLQGWDSGYKYLPWFCADWNGHSKCSSFSPRKNVPTRRCCKSR